MIGLAIFDSHHSDLSCSSLSKLFYLQTSRFRRIFLSRLGSYRLLVRLRRKRVVRRELCTFSFVGVLSGWSSASMSGCCSVLKECSCKLSFIVYLYHVLTSVFVDLQIWCE